MILACCLLARRGPIYAGSGSYSEVEVIINPRFCQATQNCTCPLLSCNVTKVIALGGVAPALHRGVVAFFWIHALEDIKQMVEWDFFVVVEARSDPFQHIQNVFDQRPVECVSVVREGGTEEADGGRKNSSRNLQPAVIAMLFIALIEILHNISYNVECCVELGQIWKDISLECLTYLIFG